LQDVAHIAAPVCFHQGPYEKEAVMRPSRLRLLVVIGALGVVLVACGNDDDDAAELPPPTESTPAADDEPEETPTPTPTPTPEPTPTGTVHVVEEGDTLGAIAAEYGTTVDALVEANDLADPDAIFIGDEIVIPAGE
jgi:LysM repeat protein